MHSFNLVQQPRRASVGAPRGRLRTQVLAVVKEQVDVAVVGGGPGGMATALAIQRAAPQLRVRVYERARRLLPMGYTIGLTENGQSCLKALGEDVFEEFQKNRFGPQESVQNRVYSIPRVGSPEAAKGAPEPLLITTSEISRNCRYVRWHDVQGGLKSFLSPDTVALGHTFVGLDDEGSHVTLRLKRNDAAPGEEASSNAQEEVEVQAQLVIGADGNQSAVRQAILGDGPPQFLRACSWRGVGPSAASIGWPFLNPGGRSTLYILEKSAEGSSVPPFAMLVTHWGMPEDPVLWLLTCPWKAEDLGLINRRYYGNEGTDGVYRKADRLQRCMDAVQLGKGPVERFPQFIVDLIRNTPPEQLGEHGQFCRDADTCTTWVKGRVGLVGDAAHLSTSYLGQGTNMTVEDAVELGRSIGKHGPTPEALKEYEAVRAPRVHGLQNASTTMAKKHWLEGVYTDEMDWHRAHPHIINYKADPLVPSPAAAVPTRA